MSLWIVFTGRQGNYGGSEGVLVSAATEYEAVDAAFQALTAGESLAAAIWETAGAAWRESHPLSEPVERSQWRAEQITLPYVGEFG